MNETVGMRLTAAAVPLFFILIGAVLYPGNVSYWVFLLFVIMFTGYLHFFVGTIYQIKGILKHKNKLWLLVSFFSLAGLALLLSVYLLSSHLEIILGIFTIGYFILHVLLNEYTFLNLALPFKINYSFILLFLTFLLPIFITSLQHPSFFYNFALVYPVLTNENMMKILSGVYDVPLVHTLSLVSITIFTVVAPYMALQQIGKVAAGITFFSGLTAAGALFFQLPIHFIYVLHFVLVYHFVLFFIIFYIFFKSKKPKEFNRYLYLHGVAAMVLIGILVLPLYVDQFSQLVVIKNTVFNFGVFLTISLMHISVSFLNEPWFVNVFKKICSLR